MGWRAGGTSTDEITGFVHCRTSALNRTAKLSTVRRPLRQNRALLGRPPVGFWVSVRDVPFFRRPARSVWSARGRTIPRSTSRERPSAALSCGTDAREAVARTRFGDPLLAFSILRARHSKERPVSTSIPGEGVGDGSPSVASLGMMDWRKRGDHQFQRPMGFMAAGTRRARTRSWRLPSRPGPCRDGSP